jgi:hypothetical protein
VAPATASRQVNNFASVEAFECDALIAVEVLTPNGNWSSYPPHRHDDLEEIYYFEISGGGFGYQRVYDGIDVLQEVRSGRPIDLPCGYHGPSMAPPGYDMYYLNVMAGTVREWNFVDDPDHAWIRGTWADQEIDPRLADDVGQEARMRLTVAQALIRFLSVQYSERDGVEQRLIAGCFGIFGHGNVAGVGQALARAAGARCPSTTLATSRRWCTPRPRTPADEPALDAGVHELDRARARRTWSPARRSRRSTACRSCSARRRVRHPRARHGAAELEDASSLQRLRQRHAAAGLQVLGPDRAARATDPALLAAMRVLTDPAETGAVTLALPQDVQAEAFDWPEELFEKRVWRVRRPVPEPDVLEQAAELLRGASKPLIVSGRRHDLRRGHRRARRVRGGHRHPVAETQAGKGLAPVRPSAGARRDRRHRHHRGQRGRPRRGRDSRRRHPLERLHDRRRARFFKGVFINLNVAVRRCLQARRAPARRRTRDSASRRSRKRSTSRSTTPPNDWDAVVEQAYTTRHDPPSQAEVIGVVNRVSNPRDVVICAGGQHARRPAQAVAHARPEGLPRRVRLLDDGLRDRGRPRRASWPRPTARCS